MTQLQSTTNEPFGQIIAGTGNHEKTFSVPQSILKKSTVIKGWIEDKESIPPSLLKGDALYFPKCDPEVIQATIEYLSDKPWKYVDIYEQLASETRDVLFHMKMYKFSLCLGLSDLCEESLWHIEELTRSTRVFLDVLSESTEEKTSLVDDRLFHKWIVKYITKNSDALRESTLFQSAIMQNNELAWRLCSLLLSSLGKKDAIPESHDLPSPASPPVGTPSNKPSSLDTTPSLERRKSPYSYRPQQKSPSRRHDSNRIKKPQKEHTRKFSATVEDTIDQDHISQ